MKVKYYRMTLTKLSRLGLSKTVMECTKEWLQVKLEQTGSETTKLTDGAKRFFSVMHEEPSTNKVPYGTRELGNDGMRNSIQTTGKALHGSPHTL